MGFQLIPEGFQLDPPTVSVPEGFTVDPPQSEDQQAAQAEAFKKLAEDTSPGESFLIGAGRGLTTIMRGLGIADPEDPGVTQSINALKDENPISTIGGEVIGEAAPFLLPGTLAANAATIPGRVVAASALGAVEGGLITKGKGGNTGETYSSAGVGGVAAGALEVALPVIGRLGGRLIRRALGRPATSPVLNAAGEPSKEFIEALSVSGLSLNDITVEAKRLIDIGDIDDAASVVRQEFLESKGLVPTRAQVTGEASDFQSQQELFKTSGRVRRAIEGQEQALAQGFENAITLTGGSANQSTSTAFDFIADRSIDLDAAITGAYKQARELASGEKIVKPDQLGAAIRGIAGSDAASGGLASAARDILRSHGVLDPSSRSFKIIGKVDATTAEQIRIDLNALYQSLTPFGRGKLKVLKDALDDDVAGAVGEDVFLGARSAKAKFESELSRAKVNKFDNRNKNIVRDILENKVNPDRFLDEAVLNRSVRSADVKQLRDFLLIDSDGSGLEAWNDVRAEAMERIRDTAFNEVGGELALSRANLTKALDKIGADKLKILFSKEEIGFLTDMVKVSKLREPKRGTALGRGPSAQAVGRIEEVIKRIPLINSIFEGASTGVGGMLVLRPPKPNPLKPSVLTPLTPAVIPLVLSDEEDPPEIK